MRLSSSARDLFVRNFYVLLTAFSIHLYGFLCRIAVVEVGC